MSTGAKNMGLYYVISLKQNQEPQKSVKNPYFCIYFQCEKLIGNEIFLG